MDFNSAPSVPVRETPPYSTSMTLWAAPFLDTLTPESRLHLMTVASTHILVEVPCGGTRVHQHRLNFLHCLVPLKLTMKSEEVYVNVLYSELIGARANMAVLIEHSVVLCMDSTGSPLI